MHNINKAHTINKFPLNTACRNLYLDFICTLTVMIPEMISRALCCKKSF